LALLPIVAGIGIVATADLSFTYASLFANFLANTCFVLRSLYVKAIFATGVRACVRACLPACVWRYA
jgi:hypothetical protein